MFALPDRTALAAAAEAVYARMPPTPQYRWPQLEQALGTVCWVKHENHTPLGAFKVRGGLVYLQRLRAAQPHCRGVIAATRGNHGQSVAYAAALAGLRAVIVVPHGNSVEKNAAMRALGAQLVEHGDDFQAAREHAALLATQQGLHAVPSFHADLVAGVATGWLELLRAVPDLEIAYVPVGQGSGFTAAAAARQALAHPVRLVPVTSAHARCYALSLAAGRPVEAPVSTVLADGLACRAPDPQSLAVLAEHGEAPVEVTDDAVADAMRLLYRTTHNVAEGAGAAALAAALQQRTALAGRVVAVVLSGGNVDAPMFARVLADSAA